MSTDKNNLVYQEQLDDNVIEMLSEDIGSNYSLRTENTRTIVAALNEILGKDIICNAVGSPLLTTDTFAQMGEKINVMVSDFKAKLLGLGVSVSSIDKIASLIEKMGEIDLGVDAEELMAPLEESLRDILGDEGVELSGEETLAELIVKVDEEFEKDNNAKNRLYDLMFEGGYDVESGMSIDDLLGLLELSGINLHEIKQMVCMYQHNFVLKNDGTLWSCGYNGYGQLGLGTSDTNSHSTFTQVTTNINNDVKQVVCGYYHTFIIKNDGSLWACGNNTYGELGLGITTEKHVFTQVTTNINNDVKQIACGRYYTYILKNDGSVWSCGDNNNGQLGLGDTTTRKTFTQVNIDNVKQIICDCDHTFILKNDVSIWGCGDNQYGQLGLGNTTDQTTFTQVTTNINNDVEQIACGCEYTFILKNDGSVWSCGYNSYGQLGLGDKTDKTTFTQVTTNINNDVKQVVCGYYHTFILKNDGTLWSCGDNGNGQLGLGDKTDKTTFTQVTTNINNDVKEVVCGYDHTFILKNDGSVWGCGYNNHGELGLGDNTDKTTFTQIPRGIY